MLSWIVYVDDYYKIYAAPKASNIRYLKKMDQRLKEQKYKNAKFIYRQHSMPD